MKRFSILFLLLFSLTVSMSTLMAAEKTNDHTVEFMVQEHSAESEELENVKNEKPDMYPSLLMEHFSTLSLGNPASVLAYNNTPSAKTPFEPPRN